MTSAVGCFGLIQVTGTLVLCCDRTLIRGRPAPGATRLFEVSPESIALVLVRRPSTAELKGLFNVAIN
jgi:hypothetical protein